MWDSSDAAAIDFSDEQAELLKVASGFARARFPLEQARARIAAEADVDRAVWNEMTALGWLGIAVPEAFGGSGLGLAEIVAVIEPLGRNLAGAPLISTSLVAQALLGAGTEPQQRAWLPRICDGAVGALALVEPHGDWNLEHLTATAAEQGEMLALSGDKTFVTDVASADVALVSVSLHGPPALVLLDKAMLANAMVERETVIDETRRSYRIKLDGIFAPKSALLDLSRTSSTLKRIDEAACLLLAAELCGGASAIIATTVDYLKTRRQFDRLIGSYQALKHPMVDALLGAEAARSHLYYAAGAFGRGQEGEVAVRMAKALAGDALAFAADRAIQFHGGFGFTYDCDAQLYRRRGLWCEAQHGDSAYQRGKIADLILGPSG